MSITVYEKPACTTCRKLRDLLAENGIDFDSVNYIVDGLEESEIRELLGKTGISAADALRMREGGARELKDSPEDEIIAAMVENPALLQRPVVVNGDRAVLARPIERALEII